MSTKDSELYIAKANSQNIQLEITPRILTYTSQDKHFKSFNKSNNLSKDNSTNNLLTKGIDYFPAITKDK